MTEDPVKAFYSRLYALAKLTRFELDDDVVALYRRALEPLGFQALCGGLDRLATELGPGANFPSIRAIREAVTGQKTPLPERADDEASRVAAALLVTGVAKFGSFGYGQAPNLARMEKIKAYVGQLGWELVMLRGGWNAVCEFVDGGSPLPTVEAQLRELGRAIIDRRRAGIDDRPPDLPTSPRSGDLRPLSAIDTANALPSGLRDFLPGQAKGGEP